MRRIGLGLLFMILFVSCGEVKGNNNPDENNALVCVYDQSNFDTGCVYAP